MSHASGADTGKGKSGVASHLSAPHATKAGEKPLTLMVLMDGSPTAEHALDTALDWSRGHPRATILLVHALELVKFTAAVAGIGIEHAAFVDPNLFRSANNALLQRAKEMLNAYAKAAAARNAADVKAFVLVSDVDSPKDAAIKFATEHNVHTIFVGTRGLGTIQRWLLGSFSSAIVQNAKCDVCVVKVPPPGSVGFPEIHKSAHGHTQVQPPPSQSTHTPPKPTPQPKLHAQPQPHSQSQSQFQSRSQAHSQFQSAKREVSRSAPASAAKPSHPTGAMASPPHGESMSDRFDRLRFKY